MPSVERPVWSLYRCLYTYIIFHSLLFYPFSPIAYIVRNDDVDMLSGHFRNECGRLALIGIINGDSSQMTT